MAGDDIDWSAVDFDALYQQKTVRAHIDARVAQPHTCTPPRLTMRVGQEEKVEVQEGGVDWGAVDVAALEAQALEKAHAEAKQKAAKRVMF